MKTGLQSSNSQQSPVKGITFTIALLLVLTLGTTSAFSTPLPADDVAAPDLVVGTEAGLPPVIGDSKGSGSQVVPSLSREEVAWYSCPCFTRINPSFHRAPPAGVSSLSEYFPLRI